MELSSVSLFQGICDKEIQALLKCLGATEKNYKKGCCIWSEGVVTEQLGVVLCGQVLLEYSDLWGTNSILGSAGPSAVFGEAYACCPGQPLQISVYAAEDTTVLFLNVNRVLTLCPNSCGFHSRLVRNLLAVCAQKNLELSRRMQHITPKTIRGRLLSYFSQCVKQAQSNTFTLPYNRQQLADHLGVDRSALCSELSKMQQDGLIHYRKREISICEAWEELP